MNENKDGKDKYSEDSGTNIINAIVFLVVAFVLMFVISKFI